MLDFIFRQMFTYSYFYAYILLLFISYLNERKVHLYAYVETKLRVL